MNLKQYAPWFVARLFLGTIFIVAGFFKVTDPVENFRGMIVAYGVVPYAWVTPIAYVVPWVELVAGVCLVTGYFPRQSAAVLGVFSLSFVGLILIAKIKGTLPESCGCFGEHIPMSPYQMLVLDALNSLLAFRLFKMKEHRVCLAV